MFAVKQAMKAVRSTGAAVGVTKCNELKLALTRDLSYLCNTYLRGVT